MRDVSPTGRKRPKETENGKKTEEGDGKGARPLKPLIARTIPPAVPGLNRNGTEWYAKDILSLVLGHRLARKR